MPKAFEDLEFDDIDVESYVAMDNFFKLKKILIKNGMIEKENPQNDIAGECVCPFCDEGVIAYSQSNYNGHVHMSGSCNCFGGGNYME